MHCKALSTLWSRRISCPQRSWGADSWEGKIQKKSFHIFPASSRKIRVWNSLTISKHGPFSFLGRVWYFFPPFFQRKWSSCWDISHIWGESFFTRASPASRGEGIHFWKKWKDFHQFEVSNVVSLIPENSCSYSSFKRRTSVDTPPTSFSYEGEAAFSYKIFAFWAKKI